MGEKDIKPAGLRPLEQSLPHLDDGRCSLAGGGSLGLLLELYLVLVSGWCSSVQKTVSASCSLNSSS